MRQSKKFGMHYGMKKIMKAGRVFFAQVRLLYPIGMKEAKFISYRQKAAECLLELHRKNHLKRCFFNILAKFKTLKNNLLLKKQKFGQDAKNVMS